MLGRTHIVLGMASALIALRPDSVPGVVAAVTSGALGGWIVDIDVKQADADREKVYNTIIDGLVIAGLFALDFFIGGGMCEYVKTNWGLTVWGPLLGIIILSLIGFNTKHRTFTHSFLCMALFGVCFFFFCRPACAPFLIGYASHLFADFFNRLGLQLFFPLKWRPCLKMCHSDKKANKVLFWIGLALTIGSVAILLGNALTKIGDQTDFVYRMTTPKLFGLNAFEIYLIVINLITFVAFQKSYKGAYRDSLAEEDDSLRIRLDFETWILNILAFFGGGIGMLLSLLIHLQYPSEYNGNWWSFCYTSVLLWFTVFCYVCNPFGHAVSEIKWLSLAHLPLLIYLLGINVISALLVYSFRKKKYGEYSPVHTLLWLVGAIGGTVGAIPAGFITHRAHSYSYLSIGFFMMIISQAVFVIYMMAAGIF